MPPRPKGEGAFGNLAIAPHARAHFYGCKLDFVMKRFGNLANARNARPTLRAAQSEHRVIERNDNHRLVILEPKAGRSAIRALQTGFHDIPLRLFSLGRNKLLMNRLFSVDESLEKFSAVTTDDILKAAGMIGDLDTYCGAAVTGSQLDLKELIDESKNQ